MPHYEPLHNLPVRLTSFVGRERELAELTQLLGEARLVTLVGAPGVGKTRLALAAGASLLEAYPGRVRWIELAPLADPMLVPQAVAAALGVREQQGRPLTETLIAHIGVSPLMLILDNCEHLLTGCAVFVEVALKSCPALRVLATSREPLGVEGESSWRVPSLASPDPSSLPTLDALLRYDAVRLFVDRAVAAQRDFSVAEQDAPAVAQICCRLDGIPLAIELAASRVGVLAVRQVADLLEDRFRLLATGRTMADARHRTLRALIDWSHDLLSEPERTLLRRLSVFAGGWALAAAEGVCADGATAEGTSNGVIRSDEMLDLLDGLVRKSLVQVDDDPGDEARYHLLESTREYAREKLERSGEAARLQKRHFDWFRALANQHDSRKPGPARAARFARLEREHDNFRAALAWGASRVHCGARAGARTHADAAEAQLGLAADLTWFWTIRGYLTEARDWLDRALASGEGPPTPSRAAALRAAGLLAHLLGDFGRAVAHYDAALAVFRHLGQRQEVADTLLSLGITATEQREFDTAKTRLEEALHLFRELEVGWGVAQTLRALGIRAIARSEFAEAARVLEESLDRCRESGDPWQVAWSMHHLGKALDGLGDRSRAMELLRESLDLQREIGDRRGELLTRLALGRATHLSGDRRQATALLRGSLVLGRDLSYPRGVAYALHGLGSAAPRLADVERVRLFAAAAGLREAISLPLTDPERAAADRDIAAVRRRLGSESFSAAWREGEAMPTDQAIERVLAFTDQVSSRQDTARPHSDRANPLSAREVEVAALIARGLTNRQIAEQLVVSERTVDAHVRNIFDKLGFASRAQVSTWIARSELSAADILAPLT
jgi:predicted ATPase/DNA-binding CsgD family transcriptional regulator